MHSDSLNVRVAEEVIIMGVTDETAVVVIIKHFANGGLYSFGTIIHIKK